MTYDVAIVGAGPAGLAAGIHLKQLAKDAGKDISVCILEKGSEVGAHILSGAVIDPKALDELIPDWREKDCPLSQKVSENNHWILTSDEKIEFPHILLPPLMSNKGAYTGSLGKLCRWLAEQAEALGVEIFPGFTGSEILYDEEGAVKGVATGDMGLAKDGSQKSSYQQGVEIHAKYTFLAEGARGSLSGQVIEHYNLRDGHEPQTYGLGIKELWEIDPSKHKPGCVIHTQGWPLSRGSTGGGFIYHQEKNQLAIGFVVALDYSNPYLSPFEEMQRFKTHPAIRPMLEGGRRLSYGARVINEGGLQAIPTLSFPGGVLIGCSAGFVNVPRIKGSHNAMKSGMVAAQSAFATIATVDKGGKTLADYEDNVKTSWIWKDLKQVRNAAPAMAKLGSFFGTIYSGIDLWLNSIGLGFLIFWTFGHRPDHKSLKTKKASRKIPYPKPDGVTTFDRLSSVFLSNTNHGEDQPVHLRLKSDDIPITVNHALYDAPEQRYCPAGVYEIVEDEGKPKLQINAQNCLHCKTCDVKDPKQNIVWTTPEGGDGPNYPNM